MTEGLRDFAFEKVNKRRKAMIIVKYTNKILVNVKIMSNHVTVRGIGLIDFPFVVDWLDWACAKGLHLD